MVTMEVKPKKYLVLFDLFREKNIISRNLYCMSHKMAQKMLYVAQTHAFLYLKETNSVHSTNSFQ